MFDIDLALSIIFHVLHFIVFQVLTRLVASSSPLIYWFSAYLMTKPINNDQSQLLIGQKFSPVIKRLYIILQEHLWKNSSVASKLILTYFIAYSIIGTMAFSNFLPWTWIDSGQVVIWYYNWCTLYIWLKKTSFKLKLYG